ncbi:ECF transporter S component, partial [Bacillus thuringiensis]
MSKRYVAFIIGIFAVIIGTLLFTTLIMDGYYMLSSLFLLVVIMLP